MLFVYVFQCVPCVVEGGTKVKSKTGHQTLKRVIIATSGVPPWAEDIAAEVVLPAILL